jgi:hypothetical protein
VEWTESITLRPHDVDAECAVQPRDTSAQGPRAFLSAQETASLTESARRRNLFARHSWENNFYVQRIGKLSNTTVLEVLRLGNPDGMIPQRRKLRLVYSKGSQCCPPPLYSHGRLSIAFSPSRQIVVPPSTLPLEDSATTYARPPDQPQLPRALPSTIGSRGDSSAVVSRSC